MAHVAWYFASGSACSLNACGGIAGSPSYATANRNWQPTMASRDNQNLQIFVIALAIMVLLLGGLSAWLNSAKNTALARAKDSSEKASNASNSERQVQSQANNYKQWMGFPESDTFDTVQKSFAEDMQQFGGTFDESSRAYRTILINIFDENRKLSQSAADAKQQAKDLKQNLLALQKQADEQIALQKKVADQAQQDAASERSKFQQDREEMIVGKQKIADQLEEQRQKIDQLLADHAEARKVDESKIAKLERVLQILKNKQAIPDPYAQPADGLIRWVNQREGKVWINLGEEDHLRPQVTFSVYSSDQNDIQAAEVKGSIEVTRLLSAHMAEARITDDIAIRPLMEGDKIYSQVWNRGRQVGFAITGTIDLDGDGRSDLDQLRKIIVLNNGKVDAAPGKNGQIEGRMTAATRYLILGEHPETSSAADRHGRAAWEKMSAEADTLNIEAITLDEFLSLMGWQADHRTVTLGPGARGEDFPLSNKPDFRPADGSAKPFLFRRRSPAPSY